MPISTSQYRVTTGAYQNKPHDNFRVNTKKQTQGINPDHSAIQDEIHHLASSINKAVNSHNELRRPTNRISNPGQGTKASLLMLLSMVKLADIYVTKPGLTTVSGKEMKYPFSDSFEQSGNRNNLPDNLRDSIPQTLSGAGDLTLQHDAIRFPGGNLLPAGGHGDNEKATTVNRLSRDVVSKQETTTRPLITDDVKIEKVDFSCIEERQKLSISDVLNQIGNTLDYSVSELAKESQVIDYLNNHYRCPTQEEIKNLLSITSKVDQVISAIIPFLPGGQQLAIVRGIGAPLFRMLADSIDNKQLNVDDLSEANDQILALGKMVVDSLPKKSKEQTIEDQLRMPEGLSFKNNKLAVNTEGGDRLVTIEHGNYFTNIDGKHRRIFYSSTKKEWVNAHEFIEFIKTPGESVYFPYKIVKLLNGSLDPKKFSSITKEQHGIYTLEHTDSFILMAKDQNNIYHLTNGKSTESFHAIKIGDEFYRYVPEDKKNVGLNGIIKTDNTDIKVSQFDGRYFIVNEENILSVSYSPCRLGRSPGSSCLLHFSDGLTNKLKANRRNGIPQEIIKKLKPSENHPGLYESNEKELYLKYDNHVYFNLIKSENGVADSKYIVMVEKGRVMNEITPICFSRKRGSNYIMTPLENMMESTGMSRKVALSHIAKASRSFSDKTPAFSGSAVPEIPAVPAVSGVPIPPPPPPFQVGTSTKIKVPPIKIPRNIDMLRKYTGPSYVMINKFLRERPTEEIFFNSVKDMLLTHSYSPPPEMNSLDELNKDNYHPVMDRCINDIISGLNTIPPDDTRTVFRGINLNTPELLEKYTAVGDSVTEKAFMSTSLNKAWVKSTMLNISLEPGHKGRSMKDHAKFGNEMEYLFPPDTEMKIEKVINKGDNDFETELSALKLDDNVTNDKNIIERIIRVRVSNT